ncbi:MAG: InlB B-repeat-containing protein [Candidatus Methanomethylophilaceae archaeon]|nr:InlB B-repeat-containing protein [Candidatus Methanomethylophilaceae archaeon]
MKNKNRFLSVFAVMLMVLSAVAVVAGTDSDDVSAAGDYKYTITWNSDGSSITSVTNSSGSTMSPITSSSSVGSWGWDSKGEYGPFNSYYAAFNTSTGKIDFHVCAFDLTKKVDGTTYTTSNYDIMWVLPKVYWSTSGNSLIISNSSAYGGTAYAHTINGKVYNYLAYGVYETSVSSNVAYSKTGMSGTNISSKTVLKYNQYSEAKTIDGGYSMQWNWYQYSLYKYVVFAVLGTMNSQSFAYGDVNGSKIATGGSNVASTGYYGTTSNKTTAERLFIENAWGNVYEWLGNTFFLDNGLYTAQSSKAQYCYYGEYDEDDYFYGSWYTINTGNVGSSVSSVSSTNFTNIFSSSQGYSTGYKSYSGAIWKYNAQSWGLPKTNVSGSSSTGTCDCVSVDGSDCPVPAVGGVCDSALRAGVSCLDAGDSVSASGVVGSRLAFVFDADPAAGYNVNYNNNGGSGTMTGASSVTSVTLPSCTFTAPTGKHFNGWAEGSANGTVYQAGTTRSISANTTYYATWAWNTYAVDFNTNGGPAVSSQTVTHGNTATAPSTAPYNNHGTTSVNGTDMVFLYWCSNSGLTTQYDFSTQITASKTIYAKWIDVLRFTSVPSAQMVSTPSGNNVYNFKALTANAVGISWNLGDGTIYDNVEEIEHEFAPGTYTISLTAYNSNGEYTDYYTITVPERQDEERHDINETFILLGIIGCVVVAVIAVRRFL